MRKWLALALTALLLIPALALADGGCEITAQGTAVITAEPDMVSITANVETTSDAIADAQAQISEIIAKATESLLALGLQEEDVVTRDYSYYPIYEYEPDPSHAGYRASHTLSITCRDLEMLEAVLSAVSDSGMSRVYINTYDVANRAELYRQALALAIEAAGEKAEKMAEPLGLAQLTARKVVENGGYGYGEYANVTFDRVASEAAVAGAGIRTGNISVTASVTVTYEAE